MGRRPTLLAVRLHDLAVASGNWFSNPFIKYELEFANPVGGCPPPPIPTPKLLMGLRIPWSSHPRSPRLPGEVSVGKQSIIFLPAPIVTHLCAKCWRGGEFFFLIVSKQVPPPPPAGRDGVHGDGELLGGVRAGGRRRHRPAPQARRRQGPAAVVRPLDPAPRGGGERGGWHLPGGVGWMRRHWQTHGPCDVEWSILMYARVFLRSYFMKRFFSHYILFGWRL